MPRRSILLHLRGWMTTLGIGPDARRRLSAPRIAEIVADDFGCQIIDGDLADGDLLAPPGSARRTVQRQPGVAARSLANPGNRRAGLGAAGQQRRRRRACAGEGQRGLHAGAGAAKEYVPLPIWAPRCRRSTDVRRAGGSAPGPRRNAGAGSALNERWPNTSDRPASPRSAASSTSDLRGCGNHTMIAVVGSLETLWSSHEQRWADESAARGEVSVAGQATRRAQRPRRARPRRSSQATPSGPANRAAIWPTRRLRAVRRPHQRISALRRQLRARATTAILRGTPCANALITGGSGGIGKACAPQACRAGL